MVPITTLPGPGISGCGHLWDDDNTASLAFDLVLDAIALIGRRFRGLDGQSLLVEQEVIAIKPVPKRFLAGERRGHRRGGEVRFIEGAGDSQQGSRDQAISEAHKCESFADCTGEPLRWPSPLSGIW